MIEPITKPKRKRTGGRNRLRPHDVTAPAADKFLSARIITTTERKKND